MLPRVSDTADLRSTLADGIEAYASARATGNSLLQQLSTAFLNDLLERLQILEKSPEPASPLVPATDAAVAALPDFPAEEPAPSCPPRR